MPQKVYEKKLAASSYPRIEREIKNKADKLALGLIMAKTLWSLDFFFFF
jgi:hypothetical protein